VARARQMPSLRRGLIEKGFTMVDGLCAIQILQRPFARRGFIAKGFTMVDGLCAIQILQRPFARRGLICQGGLYTSRYGILGSRFWRFGGIRFQEDPTA
jgi:hypothetical protein